MKSLIVLCIIAAVYAREKSECERHRERELANKEIVGRLIPECEENGDYKGLQCHGGTRYCQCWDKRGNPVTPPSMKIRACECHRQKKLEEDRGLIGAFIPSCEEDGKYSKKQCWASTGMCWCADENGERTSDPTRDQLDCY